MAGVWGRQHGVTNGIAQMQWSLLACELLTMCSLSISGHIVPSSSPNFLANRTFHTRNFYTRFDDPALLDSGIINPEACKALKTLRTLQSLNFIDSVQQPKDHKGCNRDKP